MTDKKTIAIFGAGTGLGASLAARFGHEGYRVALVARNAATLDERVAELAKAGIEAAAFPTDLNDHGAIGPLVRSIENRLGPIDVAVFAPVSSTVGFIPAQKLDAAALKPLADLFAFAPIELSHVLLPGMIARGDGAIVIVGGMSAVVPMAGLSGVGPMMAAARNYIFGLHDEVKDKGVFAGTLNIGAMIDRSAGMRALTSGGAKLDPSFPVVDPDDLAEEVWTLITRRDRVEALVPPHLAG